MFIKWIILLSGSFKKISPKSRELGLISTVGTSHSALIGKEYISAPTPTISTTITTSYLLADLGVNFTSIVLDSFFLIKSLEGFISNSLSYNFSSPGILKTNLKSTSDSLVSWIVSLFVNLKLTFSKSIDSFENLKVGAITCPKHKRDSKSVDPSNLNLKVSLNSPGIED